MISLLELSKKWLWKSKNSVGLGKKKNLKQDRDIELKQQVSKFGGLTFVGSANSMGLNKSSLQS